MAITVASMIAKIRDGLSLDPRGNIWPDDQIQNWIYEGQRDICARIPGATAEESSHVCIAGPQQTVPDDGSRLITVSGNTADAEGKPTVVVEANQIGRNEFASRIEPTSRHFLLRYKADSYARQRGDDEQFEYWIWEPQTPRLFWLYPAAKVGDTVEIVYSQIPAEGANITVPDYYEPMLISYALSRMFAKQETGGADDNKVVMYHDRYIKGIEAKIAADEYVNQAKMGAEWQRG